MLMNFFKKGILFCLVFFLASCSVASNEHDKYTAFLDTQVGLNKVDLVVNWGIPTSIKKQDKTTEVFTYKNKYGTRKITAEKKNDIPLGNFGSITTKRDSKTNTVELLCSVNFTIQNNKVTEYSKDGNRCVLDTSSTWMLIGQ